MGLAPAVGMEYEPFIEGYARNDDWETAYQLTQKANELTIGMDKSLCPLWSRLEPAIKENETSGRIWSERVISELQCK
jgi:hypothetical protein